MKLNQWIDAIQHMTNNSKDGYVKVTENLLEDLEKDLTEVQAVIDKAFDIANGSPELNMSNYDEDDVSHLNYAMIDVYNLLRKIDSD